MQVFSKLQRNSANYIFVKLLFYFVIAVFNSAFIFFPLFLGFVFWVEDVLVFSFYFAIFSILHSIEIYKGIVFFSFLLFLHFKLKKIIRFYVNKNYQCIVAVILVYWGYLFVIGISLFNIYYVFYNLAFDIFLIKLLGKQ